ncbi:MAG: VOC family protein [Actinomycetota bacterium]|nr:VOC family protein [Actinomycetota bacterium]
MVETVEELHAASARLEAAGVGHGIVMELPAFGLAILSVQDPDGINLELAALLTRPCARKMLADRDQRDGSGRRLRMRVLRQPDTVAGRMPWSPRSSIRDRARLASRRLSSLTSRR